MAKLPHEEELKQVCQCAATQAARDIPYVDWSEHEHPPTVEFDTRTGQIWMVRLMCFCISCGYKEIGTLNNINQDPVWVAQKEE